MSNFSIEKSIEIDTRVSKVWRVFRNPVITRQFGRVYVCEWKDYENRARKALTAYLLNSVGTANSMIVYEFDERDGVTIHHAREEFTQPVSDKVYTDAAEGWDAALQTVKETAERTD